MPTFQISAQERCPDRLSGVVVPDNGHDTFFFQQIENYYGCEDPLIALFVSEFSTTISIPYIENAKELANLTGIVTFGELTRPERRGFTHLDVVAQELNLPLLQLVKPTGYPEYKFDDELPFIDSWVKRNPLIDLYHRQASIRILGSSARIKAFGT